MKKIKIYLMMFLVLSLSFISPFGLSVYAGDEKAVKVSTCNKKFVNYSFDLKNSFIVSVLTFCIPGILNKLSDYRDIQCEAVVCYYDAVVAGRDPSYCQDIKSYEECVMGVNEVVVLSLVGDAIDFVRGLIDGILSDPLFFAYKIGERMLRASQSSACKSKSALACKIPSFILAGIDGVAVYNTLTNIDSVWEELQPDEDKNACERIPDIKEEIEKIKKAWGSNSQVEGGSEDEELDIESLVEEND